MSKNASTIAIYSRKSKFTGKGESIGNQVELCKEYIRINYGEDAARNAVVFEDEGFSGGNLNRPDFKRMMEAAKEKKFKAIIVYRLDRISRNIGDFAKLIEDLNDREIEFISVRESFETTSPMGKAMMYIASVFSQLERETIAERIRDNMQELAKTGRWLGGNTPTGYASESVQSVTIDGKSKKACKLKLIPQEAEIVKMIYGLFAELDSLTAVEAELIRRGIKTKNDNFYTRFSIKAILQNPVYLMADGDAWQYFTDHEADLFAGQGEFDGVHGIMAYNRTDQEKGRATVYRPVSEWIVSVGQHPGIIPGKVWVAVQASLERNKSKGYRKPRSNEALLTGLLYCRCGSRMYPKLSKRLTADGKPVYTYVCKMKERSQKAACSVKNVSGNTLDAAVIQQIKLLAEDKSTFIDQLEKSRKFYTGSREGYEERLAAMQKDKAAAEKKVEGLVDSLAEVGGSTAKALVVKRIEELNRECQNIDAQIRELEGLTSQQALSDMEFEVMAQLLSVFSAGIDEMTVEQKRSAIRTLVRRVVWDGTNAHLVLFGVKDEELEYPDIPGLCASVEEADFCTEDGESDAVQNTPWCEDSK